MMFSLGPSGMTTHCVVVSDGVMTPRSTSIVTKQLLKFYNYSSKHPGTLLKGSMAFLLLSMHDMTDRVLITRSCHPSIWQQTHADWAKL
eukprot:3377558-Amphidinium_carterae.1